MVNVHRGSAAPPLAFPLARLKPLARDQPDQEGHTGRDVLAVITVMRDRRELNEFSDSEQNGH